MESSYSIAIDPHIAPIYLTLEPQLDWETGDLELHGAVEGALGKVARYYAEACLFPSSGSHGWWDYRIICSFDPPDYIPPSGAKSTYTAAGVEAGLPEAIAATKRDVQELLNRLHRDAE